MTAFDRLTHWGSPQSGKGTAEHSPLAALGQLARNASLLRENGQVTLPDGTLQTAAQRNRIEEWARGHEQSSGYDYAAYKRESLFSDVSTSVDGREPKAVKSRAPDSPMQNYTPHRELLAFVQGQSSQHRHHQTPGQIRNFSRPIRATDTPTSGSSAPSPRFDRTYQTASNVDASDSNQEVRRSSVASLSSPTLVRKESCGHYDDANDVARSLAQTHLNGLESASPRVRMSRSPSASSQRSVMSAASSVIHPSQVSPPFHGKFLDAANNAPVLSTSLEDNEQEHLQADNRWQNFFGQSHPDEDAQSSATNAYTEQNIFEQTSDPGHGDTMPPAITFSPPSMRHNDFQTLREQSGQHQSVQILQGSVSKPLRDAKASDGGYRPPSLYSTYSYYDLPDSRAATPTTPGFPKNSSTNYSAAGPSATFLKTKRSMELLNANGGTAKGKARDEQTLNPDDPVDCCLLGINMHEAGDLDRAAYYLEKSARAGVGPGMLLWGLSLRHGWGVAVKPERGFQWIQKTAESVVADLDASVRRGTLDADEKRATTNELVLAIYELGISFRHGWGVKKNKQLAISYFALAANLGDPDAMQELGFCYSVGKGCKRDMKKAATYYRLASKAGKPEPFGSSWIWKDKARRFLGARVSH